MFHSTHLNVTLTLAQEQSVWRALHTCIIFMRSCCVLLDSLRLFFLPFAFHLLSHLPFHSPDHLNLPCGGQEPCALLRVRTLASWPRTILSQSRWRRQFGSEARFERRLGPGQAFTQCWRGDQQRWSSDHV